MADSIPCPNPVCTNVFAAADIQAASAIKCPRCGFVFQLRSGATAPSPPTVAPIRARAAAHMPAPVNLPAASAPTPLPPTARPKAAPSRPARPTTPPLASPIAQPVFVPTEPAEAFTPGPAASPTPSNQTPTSGGEPPGHGAGLDFGHDGPLVRRRALPRSSSLVNWILLIGGPLMLAGILIGGYFAARNFNFLGGSNSDDEVAANVKSVFFNARTLKNSEEKAFRLLLPQKQWINDNELRNRMGISTAWKNSNEDFWFGVYVKDYGQTRPRDAELLENGIEKLKQYFGESLELAEKAEPSTLADLSALRLTFRGTLGTITWSGEMFMAAHHGFGYWLFIAGQSSELARTQWDELQTEHTGLKIVTERKGWSEQRPKMVAFTGESGGLTVSAPDGIWKKVDVKDIDERGELCLFGRYKRDDKEDPSRNRKNAMVLITTMDEKKGDLKETMKAARELFETKMKEQNKSYIFTKAEDEQSEFGVDERFGNIPGRVLALKQSIGDEPMRYVILAVAAGQNFLVQCDCTWESRQIWRQDFLELLRTMKTKTVE